MYKLVKMRAQQHLENVINILQYLDIVLSSHFEKMRDDHKARTLFYIEDLFWKNVEDGISAGNPNFKNI